MSDNFNIQEFVQKTRKEYFDNMYKKPLVKEQLDQEATERIDSLTNLKALGTLLDTAEMIYKDHIESGDEFDPEDVAEYLHLEILGRLVPLQDSINPGNTSQQDKDRGDYMRNDPRPIHMREAEEGEEEEDIEIDAPETDMMDEPETSLDASVDLATGGDSKEIFGKLVDAYEAAKSLRDDKLTRQLANTITYFNKAVIFGEPKQ